MNLKRCLLLIGIVVFLATLSISGCTTEITEKPTLDTSKRYVYVPLDIPEIKHYPNPRPALTPKYLPGGSLNGVTIIVDPGHGGKDPGAGEKTYSNIPEKFINMAIARELQSRLIAKGAKVIMTRTDDRFIELDDRAAMAERYSANLLVSIHADSNPDRTMRGACVYVSRNRSYKSYKTAQNIKTSLLSSGVKFKKIGNQNFRVLARHSKPAVLVECGFMSNSTDAMVLNQNWYQKKIAAAIADGIDNTF